ncbi:hypothetical protein PFNF135_00974 [Plasmodium falciparum NF135/5.C10]|uniref:Surface antigen n=1 Tax=Plasmodium falciparum NF135/5.C10 TaxID=1036726 RepID=W4ILR6_PLAFA|nr:hypothetical protein PFNF135_00974 [Plasmodium falciparum NF135/5.C10]
MKVHYINILLFSLPLNILLHNQRNHKSTTNHTPNIPTNRLLCECELYAPAYYDNDPQMKEVMETFNRQTQQRFHEYDDRMFEKRKHCKDKCDKEIQKIILKDKLEKQMTQELTTLETKIDTGDIPTCVCEKSLADKVEKGCLRCAQNLGGIVVPSSGVLGEIAAFAVNAWKTTEIAAATELAKQAGAAAGKIAGEAMGVKTVIEGLKALDVLELCPEITESFFNTTPYYDFINIANFIFAKKTQTCGLSSLGNPICQKIGINFNIIYTGNRFFLPDNVGITEKVKVIVAGAEKAAAEAVKDASERVTAAIKAQETNVINATYAGYEITIIASIIAIVVIVLIMVIIYLYMYTYIT